MSTDKAAAPLRHRLTVHAEADPNVLARLFAPFVIHGVLPERIEAVQDRDGTDYVLTVDFAADLDLEHRLAARLSAMVAVRRVDRATALPAAAQAA